MQIKTKKILDQILFTEEEKNFMRTLADTIQEECENHISCETCIFDEFQCLYYNCKDFTDLLKAFANVKSITKE